MAGADGSRPTGTRRRRRSPARTRPEPAPEAGDAPAPSTPPGGAGLEAEDIRRAWPTIREAVRNRTRTVEVMLAGATVAGVDGRVIHLVHDYAPLAKRLSPPHNASVITESIAAVVGGDWAIRCTSGSAPAAGSDQVSPAQPGPNQAGPGQAQAAPGAPGAAGQSPTGAASRTPGRGYGAGPDESAGPGAAAPQTSEPGGWQRRVRDAGAARGQAAGGAGSGTGGGYDDLPPPPEEPEPEPGEERPPVTEDEMVDEARSGPQNLDHRTGEDIALALLKEHLGARPLER